MHVRTFYKAELIHIPIAGQWAAQNNEVNGWGIIGIYNNTNSQDYGDYSAGTAGINNAQIGGISFDFPVRFRKFNAIHRNNSALTNPWGWEIYSQEKTPASLTRVTTPLYDERASLRDYGNNQYQETTILGSQLTSNVLAAGHILTLAVATPSQTASRNIQLYTGYMLFERLA